MVKNLKFCHFHLQTCIICTTFPSLISAKLGMHMTAWVWILCHLFNIKQQKLGPTLTVQTLQDKKCLQVTGYVQSGEGLATEVDSLSQSGVVQFPSYRPHKLPTTDWHFRLRLYLWLAVKIISQWPIKRESSRHVELNEWHWKESKILSFSSGRHASFTANLPVLANKDVHLSDFPFTGI